MDFEREDDKVSSTTQEDITFDYNALYGIDPNQVNQDAAKEEENAIPDSFGFSNVSINLNNNKPEEQVVDKNVTPTFDTNAMMDDIEENQNVDEKLIYSMTPEMQKEKQETKNNVMFIAIFFGVILFAVLFLFPILLDM